MYRFFLVGLCVLVVGCVSNKTQEQEHIAGLQAPLSVLVPEGMLVYGPLINPEPYGLKMKINKLENDLFDFEVGMKLFNGAHFISPNAVRDFSGKFTIHIEDSEQLEIVSELIETPRSVEEIDLHPFTNGTVNWVRKDTKYNQTLKPIVETDFDVTGFIQFTIEPRCTLENIPIIIKYSDGDMRVEITGC